MNFEYSPGLLGYGIKGDDGSLGLQGLAIYFCDYNPISNKILIESAISNDEVLFSSSLPNTKLPNNRKYQTGDLILFENGNIYVIDAENDTYILTNLKLNKLSYFDQYIEIISDEGFERYHNKYDSSANYLIDNVYSTGSIDYSSIPYKIYNISLKDFTRIEYTNILDSCTYAFSTYSAGENIVLDDNKSIAIVFDTSLSSFRIGNIDISNNIRDVNILLDVSSLIYKKEISNLFNKNTALGTILTNNEVSTNLLFDPNFNENPTSFSHSTGTNSVTINWDISDFLSDSDVIGILYFEKKMQNGGSYNILSGLTNSPLVFYDIDISGYVTINNLTSGDYIYYIEIIKDGWIRSSSIKNVTI